MREDAVDLADRSPRDGNEVVPDAQKRLALDSNIVRQQQIEVLQDRAGQTVLNGNDCGLDASVDERGKDVGGERIGRDGSPGDHLHRRFVTERTGFSLNGNLHARALFCSQCAWGGRRGSALRGLLSGAVPQIDRGFLRECWRGHGIQLRSQRSAATKARKTVAMTPFMVKKAALRRRRSWGDTSECS